MSVHRTLDGGWADCSNPACDLKIHIPDITPTDMYLVPYSIMLTLCVAFDPPADLSHHAGGSPQWQEWHDDLGKLHREYDLPAVVNPDGSMEWRWHGMQHRDAGKPAFINEDVTSWWQEGLMHRDGGLPAYMKVDGTSAWYRGGQLHREDGPAAVNPGPGYRHFATVRPDHAGFKTISLQPGESQWWVNGKLTDERGHFL